MFSKWHSSRLTVFVMTGALSFWGICIFFNGEAWSQQQESATPKAEKHSPKATHNGSIAETKTKGFDGVDFSYDAFGAPSGQDPAKISQQVKAKYIAEKPKVLAKQKQVLAER